jgi:ribosomal protein L11 methyltransferase
MQYSSPISTFRFVIGLPSRLSLPAQSGGLIDIDRETFYTWIWEQFGEQGLLGVHEGTLLSEEAAEQGLETESWTVDAGEAPRERDWVSRQAEVSTELYFSTSKFASDAAEILSEVPGVTVSAVEEQAPRDWDAEWKASFLNAGAGVEIPPFWRVVPPWVDAKPGFIKINPGAGFGTGTHEATQLCLQSIGEVAQKYQGSSLEGGQFAASALKGVKALDFGSGSGILAIGLAKLGAQVNAVEIDPLAIDNAAENAAINQVQDKIQLSREVPQSPAQYQIVVANILRPVLIQCADLLVDRLAPGGTLILSGLIDTDVQAIREKYTPLLDGVGPQVTERGEWRAVVYTRNNFAR